MHCAAGRATEDVPCTAGLAAPDQDLASLQQTSQPSGNTPVAAAAAQDGVNIACLPHQGMNMVSLSAPETPMSCTMERNRVAALALPNPGQPGLNR